MINTADERKANLIEKNKSHILKHTIDDAKSYQSSKYTIYTKYNYQYILTGDHTIFLIKKKFFRKMVINVPRFLEIHGP